MRTSIVVIIIGAIIAACLYFGAPAVGAYIGRTGRSFWEGTRDFFEGISTAAAVEPVRPDPSQMN